MYWLDSRFISIMVRIQNLKTLITHPKTSQVPQPTCNWHSWQLGNLTRPHQAMLWEARVHTNWALSTLGQECSANTNWALSSLGQEEIWPDQTSSLGACKCETVHRDRERPEPSARSKLTQLTWVSWASKLYKLSRAPLRPSVDRKNG